MPWSSISGKWESPRIDVAVDMGHPLLNRTVDGFLKVSIVGASKVLAQEVCHGIRKGSLSKKGAEDTLKKMCKEGAYWGTIAGVYVGMEYGMECISGTRDWKNSMLGGVITGALVSAASNKSKDKVLMDAITGGAIATAADFINQLT